jgi:hypothetical protein
MRDRELAKDGMRTGERKKKSVREKMSGRNRKRKSDEDGGW